MIIYKKYDEIDKKKWDECVENAPNGLTYGYSWFLDAIAGHGWDGVIDEKKTIAGESFYNAVMPVQYSKKIFIKSLYQSPFIPETDVYCIQGNISSDYKLNFLKKVLDEFKYIAKLRLGHQWGANFNGSVKSKTYILDLQNTYDHIYPHYGKDRKKNLKKAIKNELVIEKVEDNSLLLELHQKFIQPKIEFDLIKNYYEIMHQILSKCLIHDKAGIYKVIRRKDPTPHAMAVFLKTTGRMIRYLSVSTPEGRRSGADTFLIDHVIKSFAGRSLQLDFVGSDSRNLALFKRSFGAEEKYYQEIHINRLPFPIKLAQNLRKRLFYFFNPQYKNQQP